MTTQPSLSELLAEFKASEQLHAAALIVEDVDAKRVLAAWTTMPIDGWRKPRKMQTGDSLAWRWEWLWSTVGIDYDMLAMRAGVSAQTALAKFEMLRASRLVYPDGSISKPALAVLHGYVQQNMPKPPRAQAAQPKKEKTDGNG